MFTTINGNFSSIGYNNNLDALNKVDNLKVSECDAIVKRIALLILNFFLTPFRAIQNIYYRNFKIEKESVINSDFLNSEKEFVSKNQTRLIAAISSAIISGFIAYNYRGSLQPILQKALNYFKIDPGLYFNRMKFSYDSLNLSKLKSILPQSSSICSWLKGAGWLLSPLFIKEIERWSVNKLIDFIKESKIKAYNKLEQCSHHKIALKGDLDIKVGKVYRRCIDCAKMVEVGDPASLKEKPLAVYICTSVDGDHNGALRTEILQINNFEIISKTHELLFCRVENKSSFDRAIKFLGKFDNIDFIAVSGHGSENAFLLGDWYINDTNITYVFSKIKKILKEEGTLYLESCLVGVKNGLAQKISQILDNRLVIASNRSSASELLSLKNIFDASRLLNLDALNLILGSLVILKRSRAGITNPNPFIETLYAIDISLAINSLVTFAVNCFPKEFPRIVSFLSGIQMNYRNGRLINEQSLLTKLLKLSPQVY